MPEQILAALAPAGERVLLDGTIGLGGHAQAWLDAGGGHSRVVGFDRDLAAINATRTRLLTYGERVLLIHADYRDAVTEWTRRGLARPDAVLLDLGLGSHQLDDPERGFSFRHDARLDMRFDRDHPGPTAAEILAQSSEPELARIFLEYGEERAGRKLARRIVDTRRREPLQTTRQLAELVRNCIPRQGGGRRPRIDPATKTFQALRIAVNHELEGLGETIEALVALLAPGGRIAIIAFHSLEDRIAKHVLRRLATEIPLQPGDDPAKLPKALLEMPQRRVVLPSTEEAARNPRARSAKLRWGIRR